ncbi:hypothetical protein R3P38DRAFT_3568845 [Favolaschia claudopus]|uniref:Uncharacterized protein n=1 Tax=Favolaschia claudopus TaxID=2862362 RepID=A0AAW0AT87_9AGAR
MRKFDGYNAPDLLLAASGISRRLASRISKQQKENISTTRAISRNSPLSASFLRWRRSFFLVGNAGDKQGPKSGYHCAHSGQTISFWSQIYKNVNIINLNLKFVGERFCSYWDFSVTEDRSLSATFCDVLLRNNAGPTTSCYGMFKSQDVEGLAQNQLHWNRPILVNNVMNKILIMWICVPAVGSRHCTKHHHQEIGTANKVHEKIPAVVPSQPADPDLEDTGSPSLNGCAPTRTQVGLLIRNPHGFVLETTRSTVTRQAFDMVYQDKYLDATFYYATVPANQLKCRWDWIRNPTSIFPISDKSLPFLSWEPKPTPMRSKTKWATRMTVENVASGFHGDGSSGLSSRTGLVSPPNSADKPTIFVALLYPARNFQISNLCVARRLLDDRNDMYVLVVWVIAIQPSGMHGELRLGFWLSETEDRETSSWLWRRVSEIVDMLLGPVKKGGRIIVIRQDAIRAGSLLSRMITANTGMFRFWVGMQYVVDSCDFVSFCERLLHSSLMHLRLWPKLNYKLREGRKEDYTARSPEERRGPGSN